MERTRRVVVLLGLLAAVGTGVTWAAEAEGQQEGQEGAARRRLRRPPPPLIAALDADGDRVISAAEIASAPEALKTLDRNGDGQLTPDEIRPPHPRRGGPNGDEGEGGRRRRRGPGGEGEGKRRGHGGPPDGPPPGEAF